MRTSEIAHSEEKDFYSSATLNFGFIPIKKRGVYQFSPEEQERQKDNNITLRSFFDIKNIPISDIFKSYMFKEPKKNVATVVFGKQMLPISYDYPYTNKNPWEINSDTNKTDIIPVNLDKMSIQKITFTGLGTIGDYLFHFGSTTAFDIIGFNK